MNSSIEWHGINLRWAYCELLPAIYNDIRCRHKAYDILHDALLKFAISPSTINLEKPHAYLRVIAHNLANEDRKFNKRLIAFSSDEFDLTAFLEDPTRAAPSPEELTSLKQRLEALQRVINRLPPKCREAFWLYRIDQRSLKEIADQLSISVNMVSRHITRAMLDLTRLQDQVL
ncbi:RNA polymerase sigma factor [Methylophilus sp. 14]|uniref:RNA polymerase sigma factor n=1 Tax=Methylophilus sp. 14 TaxID=2781019 RepID=UPI001E4A52F4|nr:sigma-70 family RNA polymerase sigma factor [Methylophilus sp. 14]